MMPHISARPRINGRLTGLWMASIFRWLADGVVKGGEENDETAAAL